MNSECSMTMVVDPPDYGRDLASARDTGSAGCDFIAVHHKKLKAVRDKNLAER